MKKFKLIALLLVIALIATMAIGCAGETSTEVEEGENGEEANKPEEENIHFKIATVNNPGDGTTIGMQYFCDEVEKRTDGVITGEVFHSSQLGTYRDYIDGIQMGSIQMAEINTAVLATVANKFSIFGIPYMFTDTESLREGLRGEASDILNKDLSDSAQLRVLGWMVRTSRNVYSSKGPIEKPEDFKDLKIRTMESAPVLKTMEILGAQASPIPASERYLALQTGVVDAAENNLVEIYNKKEYEVTEYLSMTGHQIDVTCFVIGEEFLSSLPEEYQQIVIEVANEAGELSADTDAEMAEEAREKLETEGGMIINDIPDKSEFMELLASVRDEYKEEIGEDLYDLFLN